MVCVTGDVHGFFGRVERFCSHVGTSADDVLVVLGDAGVNYWGDEADEALKRRLARLPLTLLLVHGNHEMRPARVPGYELRPWHAGQVWVQDAYPNLLFARDGSVFDLEGARCLVAGGAFSVDRDLRVADGRPWFADEQPGPAERAAVEEACERAGWRVDYVFSHTCPLEERPAQAISARAFHGTADTSTEEWLSSLRRRLAFRRWMHGHFHVEGMGGERRVWSLFKSVIELSSGRAVYTAEDDARAVSASGLVAGILPRPGSGASSRKGIPMSRKRSVEDADFSGKRVLVRVDFNVPIRDGEVADDTRIRAALPTISRLVAQGARVILMSHLGRPAGEGFEEAFSMEPVARYLASIVDFPVSYVADVCGERAHEAVDALEPGCALVLENLRFDAREKKNDPDFAAELASLGDVYVDDAFGVSHRAHASVVGVPAILPAYAGLLLSGEVDTICGMLDEADRPFVAVLGGSKVSDKIGVIDRLIDVADTVLIGGGMCFTFMAAEGKGIGRSLLEKDWVDKARDMILKARERGCNLMLPTDYVVASVFENDAETRIVSSEDMPDTMMGLDVGPETVTAYAKVLSEAKTIFWNGPMGVFEMPSFEAGTRGVGQAIADNAQAKSIVGGGDSAAAVKQFGLADKMTFISTGGGASMKLVEGAKLPGLEAIPNA